MTDSLNNSWGALTFPVPLSTDGSLTQLDPARDILLALLAAAIRSELTQAWAVSAALWDDGNGTGLGLDPVASLLPGLDDLDTMRQRGSKFPMLAASRSGDPQQEDEFTLWQNRITSKWAIDYVLGPLEIGNQLRVADVLTAIARVIAGTIRRGGHKAYATTIGANGTLTAKQVLGVGFCGFSTVAITAFIQGAAAFSQGGPKYHALTLTLQTTELDTAPDETSTYQGAAATMDGGAVVSIDTAVAVQIG